MTIARAARLFRSADALTSEQLCRHSYHLAAFGEQALQLNAYAKLLPLDQILGQARASDERRAQGRPKSVLDGVPVSIKANIAVGEYWEMPTACSAILSREEREKGRQISKIAEGIADEGAVYESDIANRLLRECGAVLVGITNMDEFGMGSLGTNNCQGITYNPLPWMQRLSLLLASQCQHYSDQGEEEKDAYWLQLIRHSTLDNPHGVQNERALAGLLDEVQYWLGNHVIHSTRESRHDNATSVTARAFSSQLLSSGGSSSGAAACTAHGSSLLSVGTDTGGSLRLPAAWTSTVGFKPSYGTWSRYGVVSYASSLDTVGFIAGTADCAELAWRCLRDGGHEICANDEPGKGRQWNREVLGRDPTARAYHRDPNLHSRAIEHTSAGDKPLTGIRVGIPSAFSLAELPPLIANAWSESAHHLQNSGGATLISISEARLSPELLKLALASYYVLVCAEASSNLSRYDGVRYGMDVDLEFDTVTDDQLRALGDMTALEERISATRAHGFGEEVQRRVLAGTAILSSDRFHTHYEAAVLVRAQLSRALGSAFRTSRDNNDGDKTNEKVDVMLVPTALSLPCTLHPRRGDETDGDKMDPTLAFANDVMTVPVSLGGLPSISVPFDAGKEDRVNSGSVYCNRGESDCVGMQFFAARGAEDVVLAIAKTLK